jgi:hypothetical protein
MLGDGRATPLPPSKRAGLRPGRAVKPSPGVGGHASQLSSIGPALCRLGPASLEGDRGAQPGLADLVLMGDQALDHEDPRRLSCYG